MRPGRSFSPQSLAILLVALAASAVGLAGEPPAAVGAQPAPSSVDPVRHSGLSSGASASAPAPRINRHMSSRLRSTLESAFAVAVQKLSDEPRCRELFTELGADGVTMLSNTLYYQASLKMEQQLCPRAFGYTLVGGAPTWVCRRFGQLNDRRAAKVLLHEALHHAGLDERPHDPDGLPPAAIDELVADACGL